MNDVKYEDLYDLAAVADAEQHLLGRLDTAVTGITSTQSEHKRVTGFMGRCANTGYLIIRVGGRTVSTIDLAVMNALGDFAPLDVDVPVGQTLALFELSTTGVGSCSVTVRYETGSP